MFNKKIILIYAAFLFVVLVVPNRITLAETRVYSTDVKNGWVWNEEGSPYILEESIYVPDNHTLYIREGVEVVSASPAEGDDPYSLTVDGDLMVQGSVEKPVVFEDLYTIFFSGSNSKIKNANFNGTGLEFVLSTSTIDSVEIKNSFSAITARGSKISVVNSKLENNGYGIASYLHQEIFQVYEGVNRIGGIGGIGNALEGLDDTYRKLAYEITDHKQNVISINNSSIVGSDNRAILNQAPNVIDATNNWWGEPSGPGNNISGSVEVNPWMSEDPFVTPPTSSCCSNVLFIPGLQASRLYKDEKSFFGTSTNTLWEPNRNTDIEKLFMNSDGVSNDGSIYTLDVVDSAYGVKDIYKSFIASLDGLVSDGLIKEWMALPYDWRKGVYDVVNEEVLKKVEELSKSSKTGKVTVVSHSNGGLVAKTLVKMFEDRGKTGLVDKVMLVAVPELGTPQSLLSMLHGHNQSILGGVFLSKGVARTLSVNMPGAYGLLPSRKFFEKDSPTVISDFFKSNQTFSSFDEMKNFILNNSFSLQSTKDTDVPLLLNSKLFSKGDSLHTILDKWRPASTTKTFSLFGWGLPTSKGIAYEKDAHCDQDDDCPIAFSPVISHVGDGTVLTKSNSGNSDEVEYVDLKRIKEDYGENIQHANILESLLVFKKIKAFLKRDFFVENKNIRTEDDDDDYEKYFSTKEPVETNKSLTIKVHSPVDIHIYDEKGNHTGELEGDQLSDELETYENNIPAAYYGDFGRTKMVQVPYDQEYQIILKGLDAGVFIVEAEISVADDVLASTTFSEMPVTPLMNVELVVSTTTDSFATSTQMNIDVDGDGVVDLVARTDEFLALSGSATTSMIADLSAYIESMKKVIISLKLPAAAEKRWLSRLDKISEKVDKQKTRKVEKITKKLSEKRIKNKKLTKDQKTAITSVFENLLSQIEKNYISN